MGVPDPSQLLEKANGIIKQHDRTRNSVSSEVAAAADAVGAAAAASETVTTGDSVGSGASEESAPSHGKEKLGLGEIFDNLDPKDQAAISGALESLGDALEKEQRGSENRSGSGGATSADAGESSVPPSQPRFSPEKGGNATDATEVPAGSASRADGTDKVVALAEKAGLGAAISKVAGEDGKEHLVVDEDLVLRNAEKGAGDAEIDEATLDRLAQKLEELRVARLGERAGAGDGAVSNELRIADEEYEKFRGWFRHHKPSDAEVRGDGDMAGGAGGVGAGHSGTGGKGVGIVKAEAVLRSVILRFFDVFHGCSRVYAFRGLSRGGHIFFFSVMIERWTTCGSDGSMSCSSPWRLFFWASSSRVAPGACSRVVKVRRSSLWSPSTRASMPVSHPRETPRRLACRLSARGVTTDGRGSDSCVAVVFPRRKKRLVLDSRNACGTVREK